MWLPIRHLFKCRRIQIPIRKRLMSWQSGRHENYRTVDRESEYILMVDISGEMKGKQSMFTMKWFSFWFETHISAVTREIWHCWEYWMNLSWRESSHCNLVHFLTSETKSLFVVISREATWMTSNAGFPIGGEEISITEGVVSRLEMQVYSHSQVSLLAITVDAGKSSCRSIFWSISQLLMLEIVEDQWWKTIWWLELHFRTLMKLKSKTVSSKLHLIFR